MPKLNLTERAITQMPAPDPSGKQVLYWDTTLRGFAVLVSGKTNQKTFVAQRDLPNGTTRRPRSSSFEPTDSHLCRIACVSIMPTRILPQRHPRNPAALSHITTWRPGAIRFIYCDGCPKHPRFSIAQTAPDRQSLP